MSYKLENRLIQIISEDTWMMETLANVQKLNLPDCWIGAGFIRNKIWDKLHDFDRTPINDVDVIYFDSNSLSEQHESKLETQLKAIQPNINWSVKNQARMHLRNNHKPYSNCEDAISFWPETATAVAVRVNAKNELELIAPYGLKDLFDLNLKHSPRSDYNSYLFRIHSKQWNKRWKRLNVIL